MKSSHKKVKYPGKRVTTNGNGLVSATEQLIADAGVFYPITPSTEMGELFQNAYAKGQLNAWGKPLVAVETEGEHAAQGGAIAMSVTGKRTVNFTSGQGVVYGMEQYFHAPGKLSTMVIEVGARALTKHALNVHCGHDDLYAALDTGWLVTFGKDAQQAADQAIILRRVTELSLNPGINAQDGFLTTHLERTFSKPEAALIREFLGDPEDMIDTPTEAQKILFGPKRRRIPAGIDLKNPLLLGPVQNQEHYMNGVAARRNNFSEQILPFFEKAYSDFAALTGRSYGLISSYNCEKAETVFVALGSAAENIEAAVDYLRQTRKVEVGVIHVNVIRPFPEKAIAEALKGKKRVIILERTDEPLSGDNPLTSDIRNTLAKSVANHRSKAYPHLPAINPESEMPELFSGSYGLGSRDFRPEGIIGAFDFAEGRTARTDGKKAADGARFFFIGIDHPYAVISPENPSCLPKDSIAVRFHSIGGWGMITTGKNLGEALGEFSNYISERDGLKDEDGSLKEVIHISANPKYGSEKKGAPTNYFLVAAPERVRVNCDLQHVRTVLCCDPKIFLHTNPLEGLEEGGAFVWESAEPSADKAWERIPKKYREEIIRKKIKLYALDGFAIARENTDREDLQTRMQGNSFLGAFFRVSPFLVTFNIPEAEFQSIIRRQYEKKFGRFGEAVVESNMKVMQAGFDRVKEIPYGKLDAPDTSRFMGNILSCSLNLTDSLDCTDKVPMFRRSTFDSEFRSGLGYHQPSSPLASVGLVAAATGGTNSKYVSRRQIPRWIPENCTQCMECIVVCPDTALPNTAQDISSVLNTAIRHYISNTPDREKALSLVTATTESLRKEMMTFATAKEQAGAPDFAALTMKHFRAAGGETLPGGTLKQLESVLQIMPVAYLNTRGIFSGREKKESGAGGLFSIVVRDLCKGCAACVEACGEHDALKMVDENEQHHADNESAWEFLQLLSDTPKKYLGIFDPDSAEDSKAAALKFHLMIQSKYNAFLSGDGACAGCGEKSVLRSVTTLTETLMRPVFHKKAERLTALAARLEKEGEKKLAEWKKSDEKSYLIFRRTVLQVLMGFGAEDTKETEKRIAAEFKGSDAELIRALCTVLKTDAHNHSGLRAIEGFAPNGMAAMAMTAHTGCNTVFGSTPPNNPHPYPWMNSLFQDGATIGWLVGESFIRDHSQRSVLPERFGNFILQGVSFSESDYFRCTHFSDTYMTDREIMELPKVWVIGGDGGMGDIGFQNVSKVVLQNRPNVKLLLLDTQVYSNTGGQNSDSSFMAGGFDMNQAGPATEGKLTEKKWIAESFLGGHGSPFVASVSLANSGALYKALIDGICYRGTAFYQAYTTCQPEHGVPDHASQDQAVRARDSRGIPEFVFDPTRGESFPECLNIKGNPNYSNDWYTASAPVTKKGYTYTVAHWAFTEARFRLHHRPARQDELEGKIRLEDMLKLITQDDVVHRRFLDPSHRSFIPDFGVYTLEYREDGSTRGQLLSRQMVLFCVERRKSWRLLQSRAGIENKDYTEQKELLRRMDSGELSRQEFLQPKTEKNTIS
ncbi:MAG: 2-oxoacid:acceptor oxidoreductase family protein [Bacteroidia bacterium]|nr:2-oxoacid:acceptor oxidoreductase family protein [Bacteroidia bacterium]